MKKILTIISLPLLLAACSSSDKANFVKPVDLQHHHWVLSEIDGKQVSEPANGTIPDLEITENMNSHGSLAVMVSKVQLKSMKKPDNSVLIKWR